MLYIFVKYWKNYVESEVISKNPFFMLPVEEFVSVGNYTGYQEKKLGGVFEIRQV